MISVHQFISIVPPATAMRTVTTPIILMASAQIDHWIDIPGMFGCCVPSLHHFVSPLSPTTVMRTITAPVTLVAYFLRYYLWLRTIVSSVRFAIVAFRGFAGSDSANASLGI